MHLSTGLHANTPARSKILSMQSHNIHPVGDTYVSPTGWILCDCINKLLCMGCAGSSLARTMFIEKRVTYFCKTVLLYVITAILPKRIGVTYEEGLWRRNYDFNW